MCSLFAHDRRQDNKQDDESSIGDGVIPKDATVKALKSLGATFNFIDIWLHNFRHNYFARSESYRVAMVDMFKTIPQNVEKPLTTREKNQKLITDIGGGWYLKKYEKGLPLLKRTKPSKKAQKRHDLIKNKLFQSNMRWNDSKLQLHWNMLEWVDPKTTPKRVKPFSVSSKKLYINNNDRTAHFVGHSNLKELDIADFYKRKQTNENTEAEMKEMDVKQ